MSGVVRCITICVKSSIKLKSNIRINHTIGSLRYKNNWGSKKFGKPKVDFELKNKNTVKMETTLEKLREKISQQNILIKQLEENGASEIDINAALTELRAFRKALQQRETDIPQVAFDRAKMEDLLKRRFFFDQSFAIYGGVSGLYDYGPMGCALKSNIINMWRQFFILEEKMLEVDCSTLTPESVLKASGHVDRFADLMVKDLKSGECFRLDHLIKNHLTKLLSEEKDEHKRNYYNDIIARLDGMTKAEMKSLIDAYNIKSPLTGNDLSEPVEFNLMFCTQIGPTGLIKGFLRPETAQGIFVNFKRLLEFNQGKLPFAAAQIGNAFRNEISPRSGLIRLREFTMAEIEHFCDPRNKNHPKFGKIKNTEMTFYSACSQVDGEQPIQLSIGEAVEMGLVANETLAYYMARIHQFLLKIGIMTERLRFRQHMSNEMAHYACDCWDAECLTSYGWIECVGCADRSAFDLTQHATETGIKLTAEKRLTSPKEMKVTKVVGNKSALGKVFKSRAKVILDVLAKLPFEEIQSVENDLKEKGAYLLRLENDEEISLTNDMIYVSHSSKIIHVEEIVPNVIEPSFGIGRIIYSLLEHRFNIRKHDEQRCYFSLPSVIAPLKCCILPLSNNVDFQIFIQQISDDLTKGEVSHKVDDASGSIGRRYARSDEISIPYGITIDFDTLKAPHTVTLRERDTMEQVRIPVVDVAGIVGDLSSEKIQWDKVVHIYPRFESQESSK